MKQATDESPRIPHESVLILLLRVSGILLLTALVPVVMPFTWMQEIHRQLGLGELPTGPIMGYLTRSLSAMYAVHGAIVLFLSLDIRRFLPVIKCVAALGIMFGMGMIPLASPTIWMLPGVVARISLTAG